MPWSFARKLSTIIIATIFVFSSIKENIGIPFAKKLSTTIISTWFVLGSIKEEIMIPWNGDASLMVFPSVPVEENWKVAFWNAIFIDYLCLLNTTQHLNNFLLASISFHSFSNFNDLTKMCLLGESTMV